MNIVLPLVKYVIAFIIVAIAIFAASVIHYKEPYEFLKITLLQLKSY